jgi:flagellar capping protein FliD
MNHKQLEQYRDDIKSRVVRIETIVERVESQLSRLNGRTSSLESWRSWMTGGMALLVILITLAIGVL